MITEELLAYIKKARSAGVLPETIRTKLAQNGWVETDIKDAFTKLGVTETPIAPIPKVAPALIETTPPSQPAVAFAPAIKQPVVQSEAKAVEDFEEKVVIKESKKSHLGLLATILVLVLVGGGLAYGYQEGYFLSLDNVADQAWTGARTASSGTFDTTVTIDASEMMSDDSGVDAIAATAMTKGTVTLRGSYDVGTPGNLRYIGDANLKYGTMNGSADLLISDKKLFVQLKELSSFGLFKSEDILNKWITFDYKSDQNPGAVLSMLPFGGFNPASIRNITPAQQDEILEITNDADFITITDRMLPEKINDTLSYHFMFDLDREGVKNYLVDLKNYLEEVGKNDSYLSSIDPTDLEDSLDNIVEFRGEAWVGVMDHLPYKFMISFGFRPDEDDSKTVEVLIVSVFNKWNEPLSVTLPTESMPFEEFIQTAFQQPEDEGVEYDPETGEFIATGSAGDASVKGKLTSLRASAEIYFDKNGDYKGFCSEPDDQARGEMAIINNYSGGMYSCLDREDAYAISAMLMEERIYCVDSTGYAGYATDMVGEEMVCPK
jgi:hypothetical protein